MKKIIALLMAMMMLCSFTCAIAEKEDQTLVENATPEFDVTTVVPEGYELEQVRYEGTVFLSYTNDAPGTANYVISIAHSEEYDGISLNDMSDEDKQALAAVMTEDFAAPEVYDMVTESGTQVYLINETIAEGDDDADVSFAIGFTIYKGYFFTLSAYTEEFDVLTREQLELAVKILSDIWFVEE